MPLFILLAHKKNSGLAAFHIVYYQPRRRLFMETSLVKSVFKSGENTTSKEAFTKMWIELINKLERSKSVSFCVKNDDK